MQKNIYITWSDEIIHNLIMLRYKNSEEIKNAFKEIMDLLDQGEKDEFIRLFIRSENDFLKRIKWSGREIEILGIFQDLISYLRKLVETSKYQIKGLKSRLTSGKIEILYDKLKTKEIFLKDIPNNKENFIAALSEEWLPQSFNPIVWKTADYLLYGLLELISKDMNKENKPYIKEIVKREVIPELFQDENGEKIRLRKRKIDKNSRNYKKIENIIKEIDQNLST